MNTLNAEKLTDQKSTGSYAPLDVSPSVFQSTAEVDQPTDTSELVESLGRINLEQSGTNYVDSNHWMAILDGVSGMLQ
jgi:hypothetical protein